MTQRCWCGNENLEVFSPDYLRCAQCETLVTARMPHPAELLVADDETDFYGKGYFESHARELGLPDLLQRSRADLPERCVHWLRALLRYKLPPARILELGSAHGGFVALLQWAGFQATGLELSPARVEFARNQFGVPMLQGPLEDQDVSLQSLDAVVLMDVLEHLGDPQGVMERSLRLLKPDGILLVQTPCYPEGMSLDQMTGQGDRFLTLLLPREHLFLFSRRSVQELFRRIGATDVKFEPAIFAQYDMFLAVGKAPFTFHSEDEAEKSLALRPSGRLVRAVLDVDAQLRELRDQAAQATVQMERVRGEHAHTTVQLERVRGEHAQTCERLRGAQLELDQRTARLESAYRDLDNTTAQLRAHGQEVRILTAEREAARAIVDRLRGSLVVRLLRVFGLWGWSEITAPQAAVSPARRPRQLKRICVDVTPVRPGGENGGAKVLCLDLIGHLSRIAPECEFVLLTSAQTHEELAALDRPNVRRVCVAGAVPQAGSSVASRFTRWLAVRLPGRLPAPLLRRMASLYQSVTHRLSATTLVSELGADLLFCPFTAPFYFDPRVPAVSLVLDLQYASYPQFFSAADRDERERNFRTACRAASRIVCISEYVRGTVLEASGLSQTRVTAIHISVHHRLRPPAPGVTERLLDRYGLRPGRFVLYPANFWLHKNHELLLTAFGMYCESAPHSDLKLVCTGAPGPRMEYLQDACRKMGLSEKVVFAGFLADDDFAAILRSCLALIFPSLYEGFGIPVCEAMAAGKAVLASNVTSLPEICGDAAILFDPRKPGEIAAAIRRIGTEPALVHELGEKGLRHAASMLTPEAMAWRYLQVFREAVEEPDGAALGVYGLYPDGWINERAVVTYDRGPAERSLVIELEAPDWIPAASTFVHLLPNLNGHPDVHQVGRGQVVAITRSLPVESGHLEIVCGRTFQPSACLTNTDERHLGCRLQSARVLFPDGTSTWLRMGTNDT